MAPTPAGETLQVTEVLAALATVAENCCVWPGEVSAAVAGVMLMESGGNSVTVVEPDLVVSAWLVAVIVAVKCWISRPSGDWPNALRPIASRTDSQIRFGHGLARLKAVKADTPVSPCWAGSLTFLISRFLPQWPKRDRSSRIPSLNSAPAAIPQMNQYGRRL